MAKTKIKIKVTKRRINIKRVLFVLLFIAIFTLGIIYIIKLPLKNVYIIGTNNLTDKEVIEAAKLSDYPPYLKTYFMDIKENLLKNEYIKNVTIKRKLPTKIYIYIEEYKPLAIYNNKVLLSSKKLIDNNKNLTYLPYITNNIDNVLDKFVTGFNKVDDDILLKISHIEYAPNEVDKERFILYMVDNNYVHVTLSKITKINKYNLVVSELDGKKGIIYLDSGDYLEIKNN